MVKVQKLEVFAISDLTRPSAGIGVVEVQKLQVFFSFLRCADEPSAGIVRVDALSLRIRVSLGEPSAEIVRVEALSLRRRAILLLAKWSLESCLVVCAPAFAIAQAVVCGVYSWRLRPGNRNAEAQTYSARSTSTAQLRLSILRTDTSAERLAERNLHRAACAEQLEDRCRATCVEQLAESNLRAAAWNNAACADTEMELSCDHTH